MDDLTGPAQKYSLEDNPMWHKNGYESPNVTAVSNQWPDAEVPLPTSSNIYGHYDLWDCVQAWE